MRLLTSVAFILVFLYGAKATSDDSVKQEAAQLAGATLVIASDAQERAIRAMRSIENLMSGAPICFYEYREINRLVQKIEDEKERMNNIETAKSALLTAVYVECLAKTVEQCEQVLIYRYYRPGNSLNDCNGILQMVDF